MLTRRGLIDLWFRSELFLCRALRFSEPEEGHVFFSSWARKVEISWSELESKS
jgi:hypothetical protein